MKFLKKLKSTFNYSQGLKTRFFLRVKKYQWQRLNPRPSHFFLYSNICTIFTKNFFLCTRQHSTARSLNFMFMVMPSLATTTSSFCPPCSLKFIFYSTTFFYVFIFFSFFATLNASRCAMRQMLWDVNCFAVKMLNAKTRSLANFHT